MLCICRTGIRFRNIKCDRKKKISIGTSNRKINLDSLRFLTSPMSHASWKAVALSCNSFQEAGSFSWHINGEVGYKERQTLTSSVRSLIFSGYHSLGKALFMFIHLSFHLFQLYSVLQPWFCVPQKKTGLDKLRNQSISFSALESDLKLPMVFLFPSFVSNEGRGHKNTHKAHSKWYQIKSQYTWLSDPILFDEQEKVSS